MKVASLFAGIGGFDLALTRLGHEIVYVNEWDKYAAQIYEKNFTHQQVGDSNAPRHSNGVTGGSKPQLSSRIRVDTRSITDVPASDIPDHDLLVGGFPCQSFSVAGKRRGFDDTRGTLFFEIARIVKQKQPRLLLLENVKGLLSHDGGQTFFTIIAALDELGYDCQWQVLNSKDFGVPQNRERVFIVGHFRGQPRPQIFPFGENDQVYPERFLSTTLRAHQGGANQNDTFVAHRIPLKFLQRNQRNIAGDYAYTVDGANTGGVMQDMKIRRLTPLECERLQGFPDNWTEGISDTQRYKCLGNAATVNVVEAVAGRFAQ